MFADNPIPRPPPDNELVCDESKPYHSDQSCLPADHLKGQDWTLSQVFGRSLQGTCPLTDPEVPPICLDVPHNRGVFASDGSQEYKDFKLPRRCYRISQDKEFTLVLARPDMIEGTTGLEVVEPDTPLLIAERSFTGHGQEHGGAQAILTNHGDEEVEFVYMESLPWFMRIYTHTLKTQISSSSSTNSSSNDDIIQEIYYRPALDRVRGTQLELLLRIPPRCTVFMTYDFEKAILRYTEYPPDANRGFDVAAAVITTLRPQQMNLRTTGALLYLPTPDFSMPYNVIILTSTTIALAFGGLYNVLIRRMVAVDEAPEGGLKTNIQGLIAKLTGKK